MPVAQPAGAIITIATGSYEDAIFSSDGSTLYALSGNTITAINLATGAATAQYTVGTALGGMDMSQDGKSLAVVETQPGDGTGILYQIDLATGSISTVHVNGTGALWDVAYLADGTAVVSQQVTGQLEDVDLQTGSVRPVIGGVQPDATITESADGTYVAAQPESVYWPVYGYDSHTDSGFIVYGDPDPYAGAALPPPSRGVTAVSPDGSWVIEGTELRVYSRDLGSSFTLREKYPYLPQPEGIVVSPDGASLYMATADGQIIKFDTGTWNPVAIYPAGAQAAAAYDDYTRATTGFGDILQMSPDGTHLAVLSTNGIQVIDLTKAMPIAGNGDDDLSGGQTLLGLGGNDTLHGDGSSSMAGGTGDDTYYVTSWYDYVTELPGQGHDTVHSLVTYDLGADLEDLVLDGTDNISGAGNDVDNAITGNSGSNVLSGGDGNDQLSGGAGDDWLRGGAGDDRIDGGVGRDVAAYDDAQQGVKVSLAIAGPQITGDGTDALIGIEGLSGSWYDDHLTGNSAANTLDGSSGNDHLDGGAGRDLMTGGYGNDVFVVDDSHDQVIENYGEGQDAVLASASFILSDNVEKLTLTGEAAINGWGNDLSNQMKGNEAANELSGEGGNDALYGYGGDDHLYGNDGNDVLDGGAGTDRMSGGTGNDTYYVDAFGDKVIENADEGTDSVFASASYKLSDNVERLTLTGSANIYGYGNDLDNVVTGNSGVNKLFGMGGNDMLDGKAGADLMTGGAGNDRYYVDSYGDRIVENAGEGTDSVFASTNYKLSANVESLTLTGSADIWGYANDGDNVLTGNAGANKLYGLGGNDTIKGGAGSDWIEGGAGKDIMTGGAGSDSFVFRDGDFGGATSATADRILDFSQGEDVIRLNFVDANTALSGDQAFHFIGTSAFNGTAGELRYEQISGATYVSGDTNGDSVADFMIRMDGLHALTTSDFML